MYQAICCLQSNAFQWGNHPKIAASHGDTGPHPVHSSRGLPKYTTRMAAQFMVVSSIRYRHKHRETTLHLPIYNANIFTKYDQLHFTLWFFHGRQGFLLFSQKIANFAQLPSVNFRRRWRILRLVLLSSVNFHGRYNLWYHNSDSVLSVNYKNVCL